MSVRFVLSSVLVLIACWQSSRQTPEFSSNWTKTAEGKQMLSQLLNEMMKLKTEKAEQSTRLFLLKKKTDSFLTEVRDTFSKITKLQKENKALRTELLNTSNNLSGKVAKLENDSRSLCTAIDSMKAKAGQRKSQLDKYFGVTSNLGSQHRSIDTQLQTLRIGNISLQKAITIEKRQVFFKVTFKAEWLKLPVGIVIFDKVMANLGNSYKNGIFRAPYDGLYVFAVDIVCKHYCFVVMDLMKKKTPRAMGGLGFFLEPLKLSRGDTVYIKNNYYDPEVGSYRVVFLGWLVKPM